MGSRQRRGPVPQVPAPDRSNTLLPPQPHSPSARIGGPGISLWVCPRGNRSTWPPPSRFVLHGHRSGRTQSRLWSRRRGRGRWPLSPLEPQRFVSTDGPCFPCGKRWRAGRRSGKRLINAPPPRINARARRPAFCTSGFSSRLRQSDAKGLMGLPGWMSKSAISYKHGTQ